MNIPTSPLKPPLPPTSPPPAAAAGHSWISDSSPLLPIITILAFVIIVVLIYAFFFAIRCPTTNSDRLRRSSGRPAGNSTSTHLGTNADALDELVSNLVYEEAGDARKDSGGGGECPVCLTAFVDGEVIREVKVCKHLFHNSCIEVWLRAHSNCPVCRVFVGTKRAKRPVVGGGGDEDFRQDLLHIFSYLPRDLNFLEHTSNIGWKEIQRGRPIIVDPGLYHSKKSGVFGAKEKRSLPASFKLFMGSEWVVLSRSFLEFSIWGWDNLPRTLLMYYTNFMSPQEGYFHTVICNHKDYQNTTVNHDLHYIRWDDPPKQQPMNLTLGDFDGMIQSGAPFARNFAKDDPVLDKIDEEILRRSDGQFTMGGWCVGNSGRDDDPCVVHGSPNAVRPSVSSKRLEKLILKLLDSENFRTKQCN